MNNDKRQQQLWNEIGAREDYQLFIKGDMTRGWLEKERYEESGKKDAEEIYEKLKGLGIDMKNGKVLEIGCGGGRMTKEFKKLGVNIEGLDISKSLVSKLGKSIKSYIGYNLKAIPNNAYDLIISFMTFQHCSRESVERYFAQGLDKLKKDGYFVFQLPVRAESKESETSFLGYTFGYLGEGDRYLLDGVKLRQWSFGELEMAMDGYRKITEFTAFIDASVFVYQKI
jgi:cyclopropane fatty-acyl-phospholipid synthase-like methyltransferase